VPCPNLTLRIASHFRLPDLSATIFLCDSVQVVSGKFYILGGAWTRIIASKPDPSGQAAPSIIGVAISLRAVLSDGWHTFELTLKRNGEPYLFQGKAVKVQGAFAVGPPPSMDVPQEYNLAAQVTLPLSPGNYEWDLSVDNNYVASRTFEAVAGSL